MDIERHENASGYLASMVSRLANVNPDACTEILGPMLDEIEEAVLEGESDNAYAWRDFAGIDEDRFLRAVQMSPYRYGLARFVLVTWDTYNVDRYGKSILGYTLYQVDGEPFGDKVVTQIFRGEDFHCSPMHETDSDESLRGVMGFLSLRPGDTDREYFEGYTEQQLAFADEHGETLSIYAYDGSPAAFDPLEAPPSA